VEKETKTKTEAKMKMELERRVAEVVCGPLFLKLKREELEYGLVRTMEKETSYLLFLLSIRVRVVWRRSLRVKAERERAEHSVPRPLLPKIHCVQPNKNFELLLLF
jgi:hypothetical protein